MIYKTYNGRGPSGSGRRGRFWTKVLWVVLLGCALVVAVSIAVTRVSRNSEAEKSGEDTPAVVSVTPVSALQEHEETEEEEETATEQQAEVFQEAEQEETEDRQEEADQLRYIQENPDLYPEELRELAEKNYEALEYVYRYPERSGQLQEIDLHSEAASGEVPLLIQWDARWGYLNYGDGLMGWTGCGPTCLSMVALYLTGNAAYTPAAVAETAQTLGYYVSGSGTAWTLMSEGCAAFGLCAEEVPLEEGCMAAALDAGSPIICAMGPGDFTETGHFIVLTGLADGGFTLNDPNSPRRSEKIWSFEELCDQIRGMWAFSAQ